MPRNSHHGPETLLVELIQLAASLTCMYCGWDYNGHVQMELNGAADGVAAGPYLV